MKILFTLKLFLLPLCALTAASTFQHEISSQVRKKEFSLEKQVILKGYDVVSYHQPEGPAKGSPAHQLEYKGVLYHFASSDNRATFLADPERYEPLYGGWCAYAMLEGKKTRANPKSYKIVDGRLLVFYDGFWGDTLASWNDLLGLDTTDQALIERADEQWESILK